jgi:hypothetical protein
MQLTIESVGPSKSGKALRVKAGGSWYGAKKDSGLTAGMTIDAEVSNGEYGAWIDKYKAVSNGNGSSGVTAPQTTTNGSGDRWYMPFVSNTVAHAINAGIIKEPADIKAWAAAAKQAAQDLG